MGVPRIPHGNPENPRPGAGLSLGNHLHAARLDSLVDRHDGPLAGHGSRLVSSGKSKPETHGFLP